MKKLLSIFIILSTVNCAQIADKNKKIDNFVCPKVYFSSQNNSLTKINSNSKSTDLENISYKAKLNNYAFNKKCINEAKIKKFPVDILITVESFYLSKSDVELPLFVFLYDNNENLVDKQYFLLSKSPKYNSEDSSYSINEIVDRLEIITNAEGEISSIVIGFINLKD